MSIVTMEKQWEIHTIEDYNKAMEILDGNEFCAQMSDDFYYWKREMAEVQRQRAQVQAQARQLNLIP